AARRALVDAIERHAGAVPRLDPRALAATAISGLFADVVVSLSTSPAAANMVAVINRQLAGAGLQVPEPPPVPDQCRVRRCHRRRRVQRSAQGARSRATTGNHHDPPLETR